MLVGIEGIVVTSNKCVVSTEHLFSSVNRGSGMYRRAGGKYREVGGTYRGSGGRYGGGTSSLKYMSLKVY